MSVNGIIEKHGSVRAFLYRRLARWVSCEVRLLGRHPLALDSKYQVNSSQDVFHHPFYWQLYGWLPRAPRLVVDLGAHCGHFSMLADVCFRTQFPEQTDPLEYLLIEPNPELLRVITRNLRRSGLCPRYRLHQGLVGAARAGSSTLWVSPKNYLSASLQRVQGTRGVQANYLDLEQLLQGKSVDLLKVDIEGAEFEFVEHYPRLLTQVSALMLEIHEVPGVSQQDLLARLGKLGLRLRRPPLQHGGATLAMFQNW